MIVAEIETSLGNIFLRNETGMWDGQSETARLANAVATMGMATPDKGDPVRWAVQQAVEAVQGRVVFFKKSPPGPKGRIY